MSKNTTDTKSENQVETKQRIVLKEGDLDQIHGGAGGYLKIGDIKGEAADDGGTRR